MSDLVVKDSGPCPECGARFAAEQEIERLRKALQDRQEACSRCHGLGRRSYSSTATWHGGAGGQMVTGDLCDKCWGSGDETEPFPNLKQGFQRFNEQLAQAQDITMRNPRVAKLWTALERIRMAARENAPAGSTLEMVGEWANDALEGK